MCGVVGVVGLHIYGGQLSIAHWKRAVSYE